MDSYLNAVKSNLFASYFLVGRSDNVFIPSAHTAYYAAFILLKYILAQYHSCSYSEQNELAEGPNSHSTIFAKAIQCTKQQYSGANEQILECVRSYNKLRHCRCVADYQLSDILTRDVLLANVNDAKSFVKNIEELYSFSVI